jgi:hypothetical protein
MVRLTGGSPVNVIRRAHYRTRPRVPTGVTDEIGWRNGASNFSLLIEVVEDEPSAGMQHK